MSLQQNNILVIQHEQVESIEKLLYKTYNHKTQSLNKMRN